MTISPVEFYAKPDAKGARIAELEKLYRAVRSWAAAHSAYMPTDDAERESILAWRADETRKLLLTLKETDQ